MQNRHNVSEANAAEPDAAADRGPDSASTTTLAAWIESGVDRHDPIRFAMIEALARRASAHGGAVRQTLDHKLNEAMKAYATRREHALGEIAEIGSALARRHSEAGAEIERLTADADLRGLRRLAARLGTQRDGHPLAELVERIERQTAAAGLGETNGDAAPRELKSLRDGRQTWTRIGIDRQLTRSLAKAPDNAGPLNSHRLMLRALQTMQAVSPAYLERFIAYAETLSWLDAATFGAATETGKTVRREAERKRGSGRSR